MKKVLIIVIGILTLLTIPVTVFVVGQRQELRKKAAPATTLTMTPRTVTKKVGDIFSVEVQIDTGANQVAQATIHVTFDGSVMEAQSITQGALFPKIYLSGAVNPGSASITVGAESTTKPITGTGTAAIIRFKALKASAGPSSVVFASDTFVGGLGEEKANVLVNTSPAAVTILTADGGTGPTPTVGAATPTPTTFAGVTPTPTTMLTGSPSPTPTGAPTATGSATLSITSPADQAEISQDMPVIRGTAPPGSTVTIVVYSDPITSTVTADATGAWSFSVPSSLPSGAHSVVVTVTDPVTGEGVSTSSAFTVLTGNNGNATQSGMPTSGTFENTLILLALSLVLIGAGAAIPSVAREETETL